MQWRIQPATRPIRMVRGKDHIELLLKGFGVYSLEPVSLPVSSPMLCNIGSKSTTSPLIRHEVTHPASSSQANYLTSATCTPSNVIPSRSLAPSTAMLKQLIIARKVCSWDTTTPTRRCFAIRNQPTRLVLMLYLMRPWRMSLRTRNRPMLKCFTSKRSWILQMP